VLYNAEDLGLSGLSYVRVVASDVIVCHIAECAVDGEMGFTEPQTRLFDTYWMARPGSTTVVGPLAVDTASRCVHLGDREITLTTAEFDLLHTLASNAGRVLTREQLMDRMHGEAWAAHDRSIDVHISRLRQKIEDDPRRPRLLKTGRGRGRPRTSLRAILQSRPLSLTAHRRNRTRPHDRQADGRGPRRYGPRGPQPRGRPRGELRPRGRPARSVSSSLSPLAGTPQPVEACCHQTRTHTRTRTRTRSGPCGGVGTCARTNRRLRTMSLHHLILLIGNGCGYGVRVRVRAPSQTRLIRSEARRQGG